ncbi:MAG: D-amino-acid transaminase [Acidiferrobacterales bacterium]
MKNNVYLNGKFVAADKASVSVFDRGFIFGDGIYEVIPVYGSRPFRLPQHLQRLQSNLDSVRIANPHSTSEWSDIITTLIKEIDASDQVFYIQITRGVAPRDHAFPKNTKPTVFAFSKALGYPGEAELTNGVSAITTADIRWRRCDIKSIALLGNVILRQQAVEQGAAEAILLHDNHVTEGAASNIFVVKDNTLYTPPKNEQILPGITRDLVVELANANNINCKEVSVSVDLLRDADEVWLTSSTKEVLPIVRIDSVAVGNGSPGPMHKQMTGLYRSYKEDFRNGKVQ